MSNQLLLANEIFTNLTKLGYNCKLSIDSSRLDIEVEIGKLKTDNLTLGRVGVFWNSKDVDHEVAYLGAGTCYFDGYEVRRKWKSIGKLYSTKLINAEIVKLIENDISELIAYHSKYI